LPQSEPWRARIGQRVVVRYRLEGDGHNDVVGDLLDVDDALHVASRRGLVRVPIDRVVAGKVVPPRPTRPGRPHKVTSITDLQRVMALHWRGLEVEHLGGWVLRASGGFTGRGNSALPLGDPGVSLPTALEYTQGWYSARGLPAKLQLATAAPDAAPQVDPDAGPAEPARAAAVAGGWQVVPDGSALVLTASTAGLTCSKAGLARAPGTTGAGSVPAGLAVTLEPEPDDAWLATYRYRGQELPAAAPALLRSAPEQVFVSVRDVADGPALAVARGSLGGGWAGLTAMAVRPEARRQGLGTLLLRVVAGWAWRSGVWSLFVQVAESNPAAQRFYLGAGCEVHHRYEYLTAPPW
jgi:GNAT superfamily N-acetyltransferase